MGEAKRRQRLDPNYGQPKKKIAMNEKHLVDKSPLATEIAINEFLEGSDFWLKQTDLVYQPFAPSEGERLFWTTLPISSKENPARSYFTKNEQTIRNAVYPLVKRFGAGWIYQIENIDTNMTNFNYVPATQESFENLGKEQFCGSMGKTIEFIIKIAVAKWEWDKCVPVIATSIRPADPVWIYIV
ncbi:MAG: hypothetical protein ACSI46_23165 [Gloeotrichia echinulata DVL01]